jgi:hypothetical protein
MLLDECIIANALTVESGKGTTYDGFCLDNGQTGDWGRLADHSPGTKES